MQGLNRAEPDQLDAHTSTGRGGSKFVWWWGAGNGGCDEGVRGNLKGRGGEGREGGKEGGSWVYTQRLTQSYGEVNPAPAPLEGQQLTWLWTILQLNGPAMPLFCNQSTPALGKEAGFGEV